LTPAPGVAPAGPPGAGRAADVAVTGQHPEAGAEVLVDRLGLRRRLDDHQVVTASAGGLLAAGGARHGGGFRRGFFRGCSFAAGPGAPRLRRRAFSVWSEPVPP